MLRRYLLFNHYESVEQREKFYAGTLKSKDNLVKDEAAVSVISTQIPTTEGNNSNDQTSVVIEEDKLEADKVSDEGNTKSSQLNGGQDLQEKCRVMAGSPTLKRTELARQILLSFIFKSIRDSFRSPAEAQDTVKCSPGNKKDFCWLTKCGA